MQLIEKTTMPRCQGRSSGRRSVVRFARLLASVAVLAVMGCTAGNLAGGMHGQRWLRQQAAFAFEPLVRQGATWGAMVVGPSGDVILDHNSSRLLVPASNMKLVTTACALERLGPDHTFLTLLVVDGVVRHDTAFGDLIIVGGGDPSLASVDIDGSNPIEAWCDSLVACGIRVITGNVLGCSDFLPPSMPGAGWSWDDLGFGFAAATSGLCYRDNTVDVSLIPTSPGHAAQWVAEPASARSSITCEVMTGDAQGTRSLRLTWPPGGGVTISGTLPSDERAVRLPVVLTDPARSAAAELRTAVSSRGIAMLGEASAGCGNTLHGLRVASHVSPDLAALTAVINHRSKNLWAEQLLRVMGWEREGDGSPTAGIDVTRQTLDLLGVPSDGLSMADGCGLSRLNLASPSFMVALLLRARERSWGETFAASLPVAGRSGNLEERLKGSPAEDRIHAKTGSMQGIRALSGYATTVSSDELVFSVMINGYPGPGPVMDRALDRFCNLLVTVSP